MISSDEQADELHREEHLSANRAIAGPEKSPESWPHISDLPTNTDGSHQDLGLIVSGHSFDSNRTVTTAPIIETTSFQSVERSPQSAIQLQRSLCSHADILSQPPEISTNLTPQPFLRASLVEYQREGSEAQRNWSSGELPSQSININNITEVSRGSEPSFWDHNSLSSINWLPDNCVPDFDFNSGQPPPQGSYSSPAQISQSRSMSGPDIGSEALNVSENRSPLNNDQGITSSGNSNGKGVGYYYVDGDGARLPRIGKALHRSSQRSSDTYIPLTDADGLEHIYNKFGFSGCDYGAQDGAATSSLGNQQLPVGIYDDILYAFNQTCITSSYFPPFHSSDFPSQESLVLFVCLYNEHFQPILPFIHPVTFSLSNSHWLLILAMAAIGSHYANIENAEVLVVTMHEFLRRAINMVVSLLETVPDDQDSDSNILLRRKQTIVQVSIVLSLHKLDC